MIKSLLSLLCALLLGVGLAHAQKSDDFRPLPSVKLKDVRGRTVDLQQYAQNDKLTILSFWATWCVPCKKELNNINYLIDEWRRKYDAELVAISVDNARNSAKVEPYAEGQNWDFDVLLDTNEKSKREFNFQAVPYTLLIDKQGRIVYKHSGYIEGDEYQLEDKLAELTRP